MVQPQFLSDVAKDSGLTKVEVKKVITSIANMTAEYLKKGKVFKIPNYATVKPHTKNTRSERVVKAFGKEFKVAACEKSSRIRMAPLKKLRDRIAEKC